MKETKWGFWHWMNYSAEKRPGSFPWHGRAYAHLHTGDTVRVEWNLGSKSCGVSLAADPTGEDTWTASLKLPPIALYFGAELTKHRLLRKLADKLVAMSPSDLRCTWSGRRLALEVHDWAVWWQLWVDDSGWTASRPRWRDGSLHFLDLLLGREAHASKVLDARDIVVCMPEGQYTGHCELRADTWSRPRWQTRRVVRAHVDMRDPIPVPGKGENAWDCGEDAIHGITVPAETFADAIASVTMSALRDRERHGGIGWTPERREAAE